MTEAGHTGQLGIRTLGVISASQCRSYDSLHAA